ncbi:unnamed protein product [Cyprideis torosa]|uniref:Methenyltetrahydrofolate synthase domain-containing protein n=1 Tax=Cyprideis torosa TaxID=163714 RepID=A0A7R8WE24_9CRUS|nr:unnamed protein product [Cyprideis torosa]CAG0895253.1 unnamed protein product [Cyprideis torosa]
MLISSQGITVSNPKSKEQIRVIVWEFLERKNIALFPRPCHHRIPNFKGANRAGDRILELPEFQTAHVVKVNPDKAQERVRYHCLQQRKMLLVPTPRLRGGLLNHINISDPSNHQLLQTAATSRGVQSMSSPIGLEGSPKIDLIVLGAVAVSMKGQRIGKGEGFADLEYAMMASNGFLREDRQTLVVCTVHDYQLFDSLPDELFGPHDVPADIILTPTRLVRVTQPLPKPTGILWEYLSPEKLRAIPILKEFRAKEKALGRNVALKRHNE